MKVIPAKFDTTEEHLKEIEIRRKMSISDKSPQRTTRYRSMLLWHAENIISLAKDGIKWRERMKELENLDFKELR